MGLAIHRTKLVAPSGQGGHLAVLPDFGAQPTNYTNLELVLQPWPEKQM